MATQADSSSPLRVPLSRERVLSAAISLADEGGIESLSMRKLAQALGVEAMSLYNHVANKNDILGAIVDLVVGEIELPSAEADWETAIRTCAISAHEILLRHSWVCGLMMSPATVRPARLRYMDWILARLSEAGFSPETTYRAYHALDSHVLGFTLWEVGHTVGTIDPEFGANFLRELPAEYPYLSEHIEQHLAEPGDEGEFEFGLDLILDGLKRIGPQPGPS